MNRKFLGPVWPHVGPNFNEHLSKFREEFLRRECARDPRVAEYLARLEAQERLPERLAKLEERLRRLAQSRKKERAPSKEDTRRMEGVPL